jgi:hypothetical protein
MAWNGDVFIAFDGTRRGVMAIDRGEALAAFDGSRSVAIARASMWQWFRHALTVRRLPLTFEIVPADNYEIVTGRQLTGALRKDVRSW